jgi:hypothetical protein
VDGKQSLSSAQVMLAAKNGKEDKQNQEPLIKI